MFKEDFSNHLDADFSPGVITFMFMVHDEGAQSLYVCWIAWVQWFSCDEFRVLDVFLNAV